MNIQKCMLPHICNKHYIACSKQNVVFLLFLICPNYEYNC